MTHNIRLIGLDMDGTILNDDIQLTEYTTNVLKKAIAQGIEITAITGRPLTAVPKEFLEIPGIRFAISANGGHIRNVIEEETPYAALISQETIFKLLDLFAEYDSMPEVYKEGQAYLNSEFYDNLDKYLRYPPFREVFRSTRIFLEDARTIAEECVNGMEKIDSLFSSLEDQADCRRRIEEGFTDVKITGSAGYGLEITKVGANKGTGLLKLAEILGIKPEETMAIGDAENDIDMIIAAGIGVAMKNGSDEIKAVADCISDEDNNHDGAAKMIEKLALR